MLSRRPLLVALLTMALTVIVPAGRVQASAISITPGWNLVDVPLQGTGIASSSSLIANIDTQLGAGAITAAATYSRGVYSLYIPGYSVDQPLQPAEGIFVLSGVPGSWLPSGSPFSSGQPEQLNGGWNLVAAPYPSTGLETNDIFNQIGASGAGVGEIATFSSAVYQSWIPGQTAFQVPSSAGFWVEITAPATWTPVSPIAGQISADTFPPATPGQHQSEVEPDTYSYGSTVVSAFQVGRFYDGGGTTIGWATSVNGAWYNGLLPNLTVNERPAGPFDRATDASVAYDAAHHVWLVSTLGLVGTQVQGAAVVVSRSNDGLSWDGPYTVSNAGVESYDKNWIVCDNTATSPYYGRCYSQWDEDSAGDLILMSTSTDGGKTWSAPASPAGGIAGLGGQPVVQPDGNVIVPAADSSETSIISFSSTDGGATWGSAVTVSDVSQHAVAGNLRTSSLPSAEIDGAGKVYVVWQDCRFEVSCAANDIVMSTSSDGTNWSTLTRIPIDAVGSGVDHFIPGLAVNRATSGGSAQLGLTYYYYPSSSCDTSTCQLDVGFISSANGGSTWSTPSHLAGPMTLSWLPTTDQGSMVGDYISSSFVSSAVIPDFAVAQAPNGSQLEQAMYSAPLTAAGGAIGSGPRAARTGTSVQPLSAGRVPKDQARTSR